MYRSLSCLTVGVYYLSLPFHVDLVPRKTFPQGVSQWGSFHEINYRKKVIKIVNTIFDILQN